MGGLVSLLPTQYQKIMKSYNDLSSQLDRILDKIWKSNGNLVGTSREVDVRNIFLRYAHNIARNFGTTIDSPETKKRKEMAIKLPRSIYAGY